MIRYKIIKKDDHYILMKYRYLKNSIGSYRVTSGRFSEVKEYLLKIKEGKHKYDGNKNRK